MGEILKALRKRKKEARKKKDWYPVSMAATAINVLEHQARQVLKERDNE